MLRRAELRSPGSQAIMAIHSYLWAIGQRFPCLASLPDCHCFVDDQQVLYSGSAADQLLVRC